MVIGLKDVAKLFGITIVACCAAFVCTLFLSYNIDLVAIEGEITQDIRAMYDAQVMMGRVVAGVSGGCLIATSVVMLLFYIKNYVDTHGKELGILKALGYSDMNIARHFWVFGLAVFVGCAIGYVAGWLYLPTFYKKQSIELMPALEPKFHLGLLFAIVAAPTIVFAAISVLFAYAKLKTPVLDLLKERCEFKAGKGRKEKDVEKFAADVPFLKDLSAVTLKSKKALAFFVAFSAFCFSAMVQMAFSMNALASETFAGMILTIGLILAYVTLFLSLSGVVKGNAKTIAMMRAFGYDDGVCRRSIFGAYRPIAVIGFVIGTLYQFGLLKFMMKVVFAKIDGAPQYNFDFKAFLVTIVLFAASYELSIYLYALRIRKISVKNIMSE